MAKLFSWFVVLALTAFVVVAALYFWNFSSGSHGLSRNPSDWAEFGEYMGGTLGGIFGLFAFIGLLITIVRQRADSERQAKASLDAVVKSHAIETQSDRQSILAIAEAANEYAGKISEAFDETEGAVSATLYDFHDQVVIDDLVDALHSVPPYKIGSREGVKAFLSLRRQVYFLGKAIQTYEKPLSEDKNISNMLPSLEPPQTQQVLRQRKIILAKNVINRVVTIQAQYQSLERAVMETLNSGAQ